VTAIDIDGSEIVVAIQGQNTNTPMFNYDETTSCDPNENNDF